MSLVASNKVRASLIIGLLLGALLAVGCQSEDPTEPQIETTGSIAVSPVPDEVDAPWYVIRPDLTIREGQGESLMDEMPAGDYQLYWRAVGGWRSPSPNPLLAELDAGGQISFSGEYTEIPDATGSIAIDTNPDDIAAPWTLSGPNGFLTTGNGDQVLNGREAGSYTLEFGDVPNYQAAEPVTGLLEPGGRLDLGGNYVYQAPPSTGTINLVVSPVDAFWILSGPGLSTTGTGSRTFEDVAVGDYTVVWQDFAGWQSPDPVEVTKAVVSGETTLFSGIYTNPEAPSILSISGGNSQGSSLTISGLAFGAHSLDVEWNGDWIESQPVGTNPDTKPGWEHVYTSQGIRDHVSATRAWSGSKSIDTTIDQTLSPPSFESTLGFKHAPFQRIYASFWFYIDPIYMVPPTNEPVGPGWKFIYVTCDGCNNHMELNAPTNGFMFNLGFPNGVEVPSTNVVQNFAWITCPGMYTPIYDVWLEAQGVDYTLAYPGLDRVIVNRGQGGGGWDPIYAPRTGAWTRVEMYVDRGPIPDQPTGEAMFAVTHPGEGRRIGLWATDMVGHTARTDCRSEPAEWERFVFQNFFDDPRNPGAEICEMFIDDVYLQFGTRARVELGDEPAYELCTTLETQVVEDWNDNTAVIRVNRGAFEAGRELYLFVIRDDEEVSAGFPITLQ